MSSARPNRSGRILRSATFRLSLFYAELFVMSAGALFATVYITATAALQSDMQAVLRSEAYQLAEINRSSGLLGLAEQIRREAPPDATVRAEHSGVHLPFIPF